MIDEMAFRKIFNENHFGMVRYATSIVGDFYAADIAQDCFIALWQKRNEVHKNVKSFLFACVHNKCVTHLRLKKGRDKINNDLKYFENISDDYIESQITKGEYIERIIKEINTLPEARKKVIKLFYGGFTPKEIATILDISESTVGVQVKKFMDGFEKNNSPTPESKKIDFQKIGFWMKEINAKQIAERIAEAHKAEMRRIKESASAIINIVIAPPPVLPPASKISTAFGTCKEGHSLTKENVYVDARGARLCRMCTLAKSKLIRDRNKTT